MLSINISHSDAWREWHAIYLVLIWLLTHWWDPGQWSFADITLSCPGVLYWGWAFLRKYLLILRKIQSPSPFHDPNPAALTSWLSSSSLCSEGRVCLFLRAPAPSVAFLVSYSSTLNFPHKGHCADLACLKNSHLSILCNGFLATLLSTWQAHPQEQNTQHAISMHPHSLQSPRVTIS